MSRLLHRLLPLAALLLLCAGEVREAAAHSGKARFHMIIDTDGAADDLRTLLLLRGNREAEVLAIVSSEGALPPRRRHSRPTLCVPTSTTRASPSVWGAQSKARCLHGGSTPDR